MVSQKYGDVTLPLFIERDEFDSICNAVDKNLLLSTAAAEVFPQKQKKKDSTNQDENPSRKKMAESTKAKEQKRSRFSQKPKEGEIGIVPSSRDENDSKILSNVSLDKNELNVNDNTTSRETRKDKIEKNSDLQKSDAAKRSVDSSQIEKQLKESGTSKENVNLLPTWYKLDENCVPPAYRLQDVRLDG